MKININGLNNLDPLDPKNRDNKDLDPENEKKQDFDDQKVIVDPFGGQKIEVKEKKERKAKKKKDKNPILKKLKEQDKIKEISEKIEIKKDETTESLTKESKEKKTENEKRTAKPLNPKIKSSIKIIIPIFIILILFLLFRGCISEAIREVQEDKTISATQIMMPDITGYSEQDAKNILNSLGILTEVEYMYNKYFDDGTVIKCSIDPDNPIEKNSTIKMYVCKDENLAPVPKGIDYFEGIKLPECPTTKHYIMLTNVSLNDVNLTLRFKNTSSKTITKFCYTLGYYDENGTKFINRKFLISGIKLNPDESITDTIELTNSKIKGISFEFIEILEYISE